MSDVRFVVAASFNIFLCASTHTRQPGDVLDVPAHSDAATCKAISTVPPTTEVCALAPLWTNAAAKCEATIDFDTTHTSKSNA